MADVAAAAAPSVGALDAVVERACEPPTGKSRAKQLRWVGGELRTALERGAIPSSAAASLAGLLAPDTVAAYLDAAERGLLRRKPAARPDQPSPASMRVREDCLQIIGARAGIAVVLPERDRQVELRPVVAARPRSILLGHLERAVRPGQSEARSRILAIIGTVMDTGCRAGELCHLRVGDVDTERGRVRVTRLPQHRNPEAEPVVETVALSGPTRAALRNWLRARRHLVVRDAAKPAGRKNETTDALWVSVSPSGRPRPGLPLHFRGLARAYVREIRSLNLDMAGEPGWEPMPERMEQLRRAIDLEPADLGGATILRRTARPAPTPTPKPAPTRRGGS
ncbi:site-specific integrase [Kitasatospora sp. DSM 101779]|uniref:site-specific integrase n=1 Tax=Kitasatospora sp. DSM 101779 TaxID=2853165 RepID=UPI0021DB0F05|nr:site-specific integrase [Kitasatospora sp. DSM 101779]MCU7825931.1 site-specific integrase [Kitasatospora sp. DSM 101779]